LIAGGERVDLALNYLCLTRTRSEAKRACEAGAVLIGGRSAKPSDFLRPGDRLILRLSRRILECEIIQVPPKQQSKTAAREMYRVLRDERTDDPS
jgi:ribosomal 50S subunit-recycling heat shock protein